MKRGSAATTTSNAKFQIHFEDDAVAVEHGANNNRQSEGREEGEHT